MGEVELEVASSSWLTLERVIILLVVGAGEGEFSGDGDISSLIGGRGRGGGVGPGSGILSLAKGGSGFCVCSGVLSVDVVGALGFIGAGGVPFLASAASRSAACWERVLRLLALLFSEGGTVSGVIWEEESQGIVKLGALSVRSSFTGLWWVG